MNHGGQPLAELRRTLIRWADDEHRFEAKLAGLLDEPSRVTEAMQRWRAGRGDDVTVRPLRGSCLVGATGVDGGAS